MREENIFSSSFDKFPAGHSAPLRRRHVKITSIRGWIRERERDRIQWFRWRKRVYVTDSGVLAKRTTVYRSADKGLGPTIHHDPRLSICHFRFGWRALRINYRHSSLLLAIAISPPESLSTFRNRRRNSTIPPPLLLFDRAFFSFYLISVRCYPTI